MLHNKDWGNIGTGTARQGQNLGEALAPLASCHGESYRTNLFLAPFSLTSYESWLHLDLLQFYLNTVTSAVGGADAPQSEQWTYWAVQCLQVGLVRYWSEVYLFLANEKVLY